MLRGVMWAILRVDREISILFYADAVMRGLPVGCCRLRVHMRAEAAEREAHDNHHNAQYSKQTHRGDPKPPLSFSPRVDSLIGSRSTALAGCLLGHRTNLSSFRVRSLARASRNDKRGHDK